MNEHVYNNYFEASKRSRSGIVGMHIKSGPSIRSNQNSGKKAIQVPKLNLGAQGKTLSAKKASVARNITQYYQSQKEKSEGPSFLKHTRSSISKDINQNVVNVQKLSSSTKHKFESMRQVSPRQSAYVSQNPPSMLMTSGRSGSLYGRLNSQNGSVSKIS